MWRLVFAGSIRYLDWRGRQWSPAGRKGPRIQGASARIWGIPSIHEGRLGPTGARSEPPTPSGPVLGSGCRSLLARNYNPCKH